jgi:hypothetical protein
MKLFKKLFNRRKVVSEKFTEEYLQKLTEEFTFVAGALEYAKQSAPRLIRQVGRSEDVMIAINSLSVEKMVLSMKVEYLRDFLEI